MKSRSILVATPCYGGQTFADYTQSSLRLLNACNAQRVPIGFVFLKSDSLIPRARNNLAHTFLKSDFTHLMWIDADITFDPDDLLRMLATSSPDPEDDPYDVLCGIYQKKEINWEYVHRAVKQGASPEKLKYFTSQPVLNASITKEQFEAAAREQRPLEVTESGTGCMLVRRATLDKIAAHFDEERIKEYWQRQIKKHFFPVREIAAHFGFWYQADHPGSRFEGETIAGFFNLIVHPTQNRLLSEDYSFCWRAQQAGLRIWVDLFTRLGHTGTHVFEHSLVKTDSVVRNGHSQNQRTDTQEPADAHG